MSKEQDAKKIVEAVKAKQQAEQELRNINKEISKIQG